MKNFVSRTVASVVFLVLVATSFGLPAHAAPGDADLRELSRYQLTMADVRKFAAANEALAKQPKAEESDDEEEDDDSSGNESLDQMAARIEKNPAARKALADAGLSARQYAVITMALFQASFAQFAIDQGADPAKVAKDASVNPANLKFVKEHKAELEKLKPSRRDD